MKKIVFLITLLFATNAVVFSQSAKEMLKEIEGKYQLDDNNNVTFVKVIDAPTLTKDEIFQRAMNYFTYNYGSGKSVIQTQDKEAGIIVGKGLYGKVHIGISLITTTLDTWHVLRIDVKDGKVRAILTLTQYEKTVSGGNSSDSHSTMDVSTTYPINPKGGQKTIMTKAFYKSYQKAQNSLNSIEKAIMEGSTSSEIENEDW